MNAYESSAVQQSHYLGRNLQYEVPVRALFATCPGRRAIVFVHGYGGDPISTWSDFDLLSMGNEYLRPYDLMFYGYDGLFSELIATSALFYAFLHWLFDSPVSTINRSLPVGAAREEDFAYDEVILVCHSLGAVVVRWALMQATRAGKPWVSKTRMVLFAPAHSGATVVQLALELRSHFPFLPAFIALARFKSPLIDQLKPGSAELIKLKDDTELLLQEGGNRHLIATCVRIAEFEHVVKNLTFCRDPDPIALRGTRHRTVCKPRRNFPDPLLALLESL